MLLKYSGRLRGAAKELLPRHSSETNAARPDGHALPVATTSWLSGEWQFCVTERGRSCAFPYSHWQLRSIHALLQVIEKFLKRAKVSVRVLPLFDCEWPPEVKVFDGAVYASDMQTDLSSGQPLGSAAFTVEKLKYGYAMLPDVSKFGPMYFCRMQIMGL